MREKEYFIGLDIGTDSVGWAVTDTEYNLLKANQKTLWGVRLFEMAETAAARRLFRTNRRRLERRKQRIDWLQQLFDEEIHKVDPAFFLRLQESKFCLEDKDDKLSGKFALFSDPGFTDKEYHKNYPTIYHLRKALLTESGEYDVRLVYLAIHHILKNRGHFLFDGALTNDAISFKTAFSALSENLQDEYDLSFELADPVAFEAHLKDRTMNITRKKKALKQDAGTINDSITLNAVIDMMAGAKVKLADLYQAEALKDGEPRSLSLAEDFDAKEAQLEATLGDKLELIRYIKAVYDWAVLDDTLCGQKYLSFAKVQSYEKHRADLIRLKREIKRMLPKAYKEIFHECRDGLDNYPAYSGKTKCNYRCSYDNYAKYLKKTLTPAAVNSPVIKQILEELSNGTFLTKQVEKSNSVIPNQINRRELVDILDRAGDYMPFLIAPDANGKTTKEKIIAIFDFRVPYYVGPLNSNSEAAWVERSSEKIYPWNIRDVVDLDTSAERFIVRMTSKCTYIGRPVLPKDSLLYSEFMVLNELNNLCINGRRISPELKNDIVRELFMKNRKVTNARLLSYLRSIGAMGKDDSVSGIDGDFKASLQTHIFFSNILERVSRTDVEDIIKHLVLFADDRKLLRRWMDKTYGKSLFKEDIDIICKQKFSGWGRLSREFLTEVYHIGPTGEAVSVVEMLRRTNCNLMELLSSRFTFIDAVEKYKAEHNSMTVSSAKQYVADSYASPAVKRAILQTVGIVDEVVKIMDKVPPKRIFVEMARGEEEKKRTVSRRDTLMELYKKCGEDANSLFAQLRAKSESDLRREKLYLYYTQLGKCMYSGRPIDIERLDSDYDIDHIFPQSRVKDDSINNRVLVEKPLNHEKGNIYPIAQSIRETRGAFWYMLKEKGLIEKNKYERLTRVTGFSDDELAGFIARQLVETRQSSKIVADILKKRYGSDSEVVYVKAGNVSMFRQEADVRLGQDRTYDFVKCREVNDFHHAKDAYLNIVVGNVYHVKFTIDPRRFIREDATRNYSMNKVFDYTVTRNGEIAWTPGEDCSMAVVRKTIRKNNILFTRLATEVGGSLFDQMITEKGKGQTPIKTSDPRMSIEKYGGYNKLTGVYFCLVEHKIKKNRIRTIEPVFLMYKERFENTPERYCTEILGLQEPKVLIRRIKINSLISYDGFRMHISSRTGDRLICKNANQLILSPEWQYYIKQISKYLDRCKKGNSELPVTEYDVVTLEGNKNLYIILLDKLRTNIYGQKFFSVTEKFSRLKERFCEKTIFEQCSILLSMVRLFSNSNTSGADLRLLGEGKVAGRLGISNKIADAADQKQYIIHSSITGVFEQKINLAEVDASSGY